MEGTIVRIVADKGFGFIKSGEYEYFFHRSKFDGHWDDLVDDIRTKKIKVRFDETTSSKGPRAENVTRLDGGLMI